jgi:hypothetical protein
MSLKINTIHLVDLVLLDRVVDAVDQAQSIKTHLFSGIFLACNPIAEEDNTGNIIVYPQNPSNSDYSELKLKTIIEYGDLDFPLDAEWNPFTKRLWIADSGNNSIVILNSNDYSFIKSLSGFTLPHSIISNKNNRSFFIKSFFDTSTQLISQIDSTGEVLFELQVPGSISSLTIDYTSSYLNEIPKYFSMDFDNDLNRLWFCSGSVLYMVDLDTKQIVENDLESGRLNDISCVSVDRKSGNAFVIINDTVNYYVQQIFKDNNKLLGTAYLEEQPLP